MKVILYMAISINGLIAKSDDDTSWISREEWDSYSTAVQSAGNLIVGRRTYGILTEQPEFIELKKVKVVVVSKGNIATKAENHFVASSPKQALELFGDNDTVMVAGGGILNAAFMTENLVDELFIDIEPIILGEGIPLFIGKNFTTKLKYLGQKMITENEIQLHYEIVR